MVLGLVAVLAVLAFFMASYYEPANVGADVSNKTLETSSNLLYSYEVTKYPSSAEVSNPRPVNSTLTLGVAVDTSNLNFGIIPAGENTGKRSLQLANLEDAPAMVTIVDSGSVAPFVTFDRNDFVLQPRENTTVDAVFHADNASIGSYDGQIDVIVKRPKFAFLNGLW